MTTVSVHQTNFTSGEISPYLASRSDLNQYNNSASTLQNFLVRGQGGIIKRSGTVYVAEVKDSANATRLIPFEYSNTDAYAIELGAGYFRFYRSGAQILSTAAITNGTFTTDLTGWTDDDTGTGASTHSVNLMKLNGGAGGVAARTQSVAFVGTAQYTLTFTVATNTCTYKIGTTSGGTQIATGTGTVGSNSINFTPSAAGTIYIQFSNSANNDSDVDTVALSTPIYQVDNPYSQAEIDNVRFAQSYDILYLVNANYAPRQLVRTGHSNWAISTITFVDGPYYDITDPTYGGSGSNITLDPSANTGSGVTVTASAALFVSTDVGRFIRFRSVNSAAWGYCIITGYTSSTIVTVTVLKDFDANTLSEEWRLGYWSATTGYPSTVTFYEQRMVFANSLTKKQTIWFSTAGNIYDFQPDNSLYKGAVDATTAMTYTIADNKANVIQWIAPQKTLFLGTSGGVWIARASNAGEALTPDTLSIVPIINEGASEYAPIVSRTAVIYPHRFGRKVLEIGYSFTDDAYKSADLALLAEHRTEGKSKWLANSTSPNYLIWSSTEDGELSCFTYIREQNVIAWCRQLLGGTDVSVNSIISIPGTTEDEVWMIVSRTIDGSTKQYIEYLSPTFLTQDVEDAVFVDSAIAYSGAATDTLTGLDHLEGETVQVFGDGGQVVATSVVTAGAITLSEEVTNAVVGLSYDSIMESNALNAQVQSGPIQGKRARINKAALELYRSYGGEIGSSADDLEVMPEYSSETYMGNALSLFTGTVEHFIKGSIKFAPKLYIKHSLPVPFTLTGITYQANITN
jgi:hypothetical protein